MLLLVLLLACTIALSGGFIAGVIAGRCWAEARAEMRRPPEPWEILAELRGPLGLGRR